MLKVRLWVSLFYRLNMFFHCHHDYEKTHVPTTKLICGQVKYIFRMLIHDEFDTLRPTKT